eukprot:3457864-Rhodomonas_salina.2
MSENVLGEEGVGSLACVLAGCKALVHLDLSENAIGDEGARRLAQGLEWCSSLAYLDLTGNGVGEAGVRALSSVCSCVRRYAACGDVELVRGMWRSAASARAQATNKLKDEAATCVTEQVLVSSPGGLPSWACVRLSRTRRRTMRVCSRCIRDACRCWHAQARD